jgi:hypothetical protein
MRTVVLSFFLLFLVGLGLLYGFTESFAATATAAATNKKRWSELRAKWIPAYVLNRASATPAQNEYYTLLIADPKSERIDTLMNAPHKLTMQQMRNIYDVEIKTMLSDIEEWETNEGFVTVQSPELTTWLQTWNQWKPMFDEMLAQGKTTSPQFIFNNSVDQKSPGSKRGTMLLVQETATMKGDLASWAHSRINTNPRPFLTPATPAPPKTQVNTLTRAMDGTWKDPTQIEWVPKRRKEPCDCSNNPDYIKKDEIPCWNCTL